MGNASMRRTEQGNGLDAYATEKLAVRAAIQHGVFAGVHHAWDPCDGIGHISSELKRAGFRVSTSDIKWYGEPLTAVGDFLESSMRLDDADTIVFNPPYKLTTDFLNHAVALSPRKIIMFNRWSFLETPERSENLSLGVWPLTDIYIFSYRVGCQRFDEGGLINERVQRAVQYAWFVFDMDKLCQASKPVIHWIQSKPVMD